MRTRSTGRTAVIGVSVGALLLAAAPAAGAAWAGTPTATLPTITDTASGWSSAPAALPAMKSGQALKTAQAGSRAFTLDSTTLLRALAGAPVEHTAAAAGRRPVVSIPGADGALHRFRFLDSPVMQPGLASKVAFTSYAATAVDEPSTTARFDYSPTLGFHATVRSPSGSWNVDPAYKGDTSTYLAHRGDLVSTLVERDVETQAGAAATAAVSSPAALPAAGDVVVQRTYRMALANNPQWADLVGVANVDSIKAAIVNRLNEIYNDDLPITFVLVDNNDLLDFNTQAQYTGANGPCGANACYTPTNTDDLSSCGPVIDQNVPVFDTIIGDENFDIGHILALGATGGVAAGRAGQDQDKAKGCSGAGDGKSDFLAVEFMAHEVGHQFGANHSFSSASCGSFSAENAVETGSGATIMSYAGTCEGTDNTQRYSEPYFGENSIKEMQTYITSTVDPADNGGRPVENGGFTAIPADNHNPLVTVPAALAIPVRTPFTLSGAVTDADAGQVPVNVWEQNDVGTIRPLQDNDKPDGPLFRIFSSATESPDYETTLNASGEAEATAAGSTRTFPDLAQIAAGNTNAAAGTCPTADPDNQVEKECFAEFLPTSARTMHFDLTARDRYVSSGGVTTAETTVTVAGTTPFKVTNTAGSVVAGSSYAVTWNVAGTTGAPFNVTNVKVAYSTDGGLTFPNVLAPSTANNGTATVTIPAGTTTTARFKVEAFGQPFFDMSHADLTVTAASGNAAVLSASNGTAAPRSPSSVTFDRDATTATGTVQLVALPGTGTVPVTRTCASAGGATVPCSGPVRTVTLTPVSDLVPGASYRLKVSPTAGVNAYTGTTFRAAMSLQDSQIDAQWSLKTASKAIGGSYRVATTGSVFTNAFTGTSTALWTVKGPAYGKVRVAIDGTVKSDLDLYSPTFAYRVKQSDTGLSSGAHVLTMTVLGTKAAGSTGVVGTVDAVSTSASDCTSSTTCTYAPADPYLLNQVARTGATDGQVVVSSVAGTMLDQQFSGTGVDVRVATGATMGMFTISIDGTAVGTYDTAGTTGYRVISTPAVASGLHRITLTLVGSKQVAVDRFLIR